MRQAVTVLAILSYVLMHSSVPSHPTRTSFSYRNFIILCSRHVLCITAWDYSCLYSKDLTMEWSNSSIRAFQVSLELGTGKGSGSVRVRLAFA